MQNPVPNKSKTNKDETKFYYTIVAPDVFCSNSDYKLSLTIHDSNCVFYEQIVVRISIEETNNPDGFKVHQDVEMKPNETVIATIPIGDIPTGCRYVLIVKNVSGIELEYKESLVLETMAFTILIQTDKAVYKPNDCIKYRVLVLDNELKAVTIRHEELNIRFVDANGILLKQLNGVNIVNGVFSGDYQLSDSPSFGDWQIKASIGDQERQFKLQVAEYVLPKFTFEIDAPNYFVLGDEKFCVSTHAKYTNGKPVRGTATVSVARKKWYFRTAAAAERYNNKIVRKTVAVDGKETFEFDVRNEIIIPNYFVNEKKFSYLEYQVRAEFTETLTGLSRSTEKTVKLYLSAYRITSNLWDLIKKPNITMSVRTHGNSPVDLSDPQKKKISISIQRDDSGIEETSYDLDKNGNFEFDVDVGNERLLSFYAEYCNERIHIDDIYPHGHCIPEFSMKIKTEKCCIGQEIVVEISSESPLQSYTYAIVAENRLLESKTITPSSDDWQHSQLTDNVLHEFKFVPDIDFAPKAEIVVYYTKAKTIKSAYLSISLPRDFQNFIELDAVPSTVRPGQMIDVNIKSSANAFVGLLGVDKGVKLLGSGNDLTCDEVWNAYTQHSKKRCCFQHNNFCRTGLILFTNLIEPHHIHDRDNLKGRLIMVSLSLNEADNRPNVRRDLSAAPQRVPALVKPVIRKEFPETWIWETIEDKSSMGTLRLTKKVPDSLTTWMLTGFSIDPVNGLALTKKPSEVCVQQQFYISMDLPYSVKRGEILTLPCSIFNYLPNEIEVEIILENDHNEFEFVDSVITNEIQSEIRPENFRKKKLTIRSEDAVNAFFTIRPSKVGLISIKVSALSTVASDCVIKTLRVECEGIPQFVNKSVYVDLRKESQIEPFTLSIDVPKIALPDSTRIEIKCVGDMFGGTMENLEKLIRMPSGCGEQNMLNFVPNIVILNYLKNTQQLTPEIEGKVKRYMEIGYQRELNYQHKDGSFSAFGEIDRSGSTWLTAFVAKAFRQAVSHITVEDRTIDKALKWLSSAQSDDGSFTEKGTIFHKEMQGGSSNGLALTAYVLTAFLVNRNSSSEYEGTIQKALQSITESIDKCSDVYALTVSAYSLQLANHESTNVVLDRLEKQAKSDGHRKWWDRSVEEAGYRRSETLNVEITAYALLTLQLVGRSDLECLPIVKWLLSQRNNRGGFKGTQDTILGIEALATFAPKIVSKEVNVKIDISTPDGAKYNFVVNNENSLVLQSHVVSPYAQSVTVNATGKGIAFVELGYRYNIDTAYSKAAFSLKPVVTLINDSHMSLHITTAYLPSKSKDLIKRSNMVVMEIALPSGFVPNSDLLNDLRSSLPLIKRIEMKNSDSAIILYFDYLDSDPVTLKIDGFRKHFVEEQKPACVWIYDYYDNALSAREFYSLPSNGSN